MNDIFWLLTLIIFLPTIGAIGLLFVKKESIETLRAFGLVITFATFILTCYLGFKVFDPQDPGIQPRAASIKVDQASPTTDPIVIAKQHSERGLALSWIRGWRIEYRLGYDGISVPLVLLTGLISFLGMIASWSIQKEVKGYLILYLLLETGMMGVFLALDFFLFYVFWEVMLLPMYFLIGIWGGPRREYAAIKFFLYTLFGSILMLIALLMLYFGSGVGGAEPTFNILKLSAIGQGLIPEVRYDSFVQLTAFVLLFIGFAIKVPVWPFHTWLPDAHVEAPTPISMILAGVLLKMGGYGILRIAFPICPAGAQAACLVMVALGIISIIYGAFAALAQTDFKRMVAYSSVSHMGYVLLGIAVWKLNESGSTVGADHWLQGINGAMFQMIAHGISSAGMFFMVGVIYDRVHHRDLNKFGGLAGLMPNYTGLAIGIFFAGLGLPGLCGFIGEVFVVLSTWNYSPVLAIIAASGVILTAGYILWAIQRVYLGAEYRGPHPEAITPMSSREQFVGWVLLILAIVLGVYPEFIFGLMRESMEQFVATIDAGYQASLKSLTTTALK